MSAENVPSITLSVFVSSPGDMGTERARARQVITELSGRVIEGTRVTFVPMLYEEHTAHIAGVAPQLAVDYFLGCADQMDIYVGFFGNRMGSPVVVKERRLPSGTRYEFETAYKGFRNHRRPLLLLYRCQRPPGPDADPAQVAEVAEFFGNFRGEHRQYDGLPGKYTEVDEFAAMLAADLEQVAKHIIRETFARQQESTNKELAELVSSVRTWLATFEDLFGKAISKQQERERERLFRIHFHALPDPHRPEETVTAEVLPRPNESLLDVFDQWGWRMLMVGERGTGKTFAMLKLMQDLTERAFHKPGEPVPVFFNLSSWSETYNERARRPSLVMRVLRFVFPEAPRPKHTLDQWLEDQLVRNYSMQRRAARQLLGSNAAIICLDGLDELGAGSGADEAESREMRETCAQAIQATLANHAVRMILCCREQTWHELVGKPPLGPPLQTQLLTAEEVFDDLRHWRHLEGLQTAMAQSPVLLERARVALFLGMLRIAYQGMEARQILGAAALPELAWEKHLLDHYVDRCMKLAPPESRELNKELIPDCLSWMARQPDNDFLLDDLQPSVLRLDDPAGGEASWRRYRFMSVAVLAFILMVIETVGPGLSLAVEFGYRHGWLAAITRCLMMWGASAAILFPLYLGAFASRSWVGFGFFFGLAWTLDASATVWLSLPFKDGGTEALSGTWQGAWELFKPTLPCAFFFFMLMGMQSFERLREHRRRYSSRPGVEWYEILPIEPMNWTWFDDKSLWRGGWIGLLVGPVVLGIALFSGQGLRGVVAAVMMTLLVCTFSGLAGTGTARVAIEPNQGMARSLRHALLMFAVFVTVGCLCFGINYGMARGWVQGVAGAFLGFAMSFAFFVFGGIPVIRQFCLGSVLHAQGKLPTWRCWPPWKATVGFLDDLVRYKLLRRSAGGYMFRHQSLREYYRYLGAGGEDNETIRPSEGRLANHVHRAHPIY